MNKKMAGENVAYDTRELFARLIKCEAGGEASTKSKKNIYKINITKLLNIIHIKNKLFKNTNKHFLIFLNDLFYI